MREELSCFGDVHPHGGRDGFVPDTGVQSLFTQAGSATIGTARIAAITAQENAHVQFVFLCFEKVEKLPDASTYSFSLQNDPLLVFGQIAKRNIEADAAFRLHAEVTQPFPALGFGPRVDGAFVN